MLRLGFRIFLFLAIVSTSSVWAQNKPDTPEYDVKEHYTKYEYRIPMRDGIRLFTSVYVPKDVSHTYPFLIDRTPYSVAPYGVDLYRGQLGPSPDFERSGYIFVFQDVRGRFMSEGKFIEMRPHIDDKKSKQDVDDASDLYDTIDWLLKNVPNNSGKVGVLGVSYPGFLAISAGVDAHPAVKAISPQAPMTNIWLGDDFFHNGAFRLSYGFEYTALLESSSENFSFAFDRFVIDLDARSVETADVEAGTLQLTSAEFDLLGCFVQRPRRVLSRDQILDFTRGRAAEPFDRTVAMLSSRLRKKLDGASPGSNLITTVRNGGYLFTVAVKQVP